MAYMNQERKAKIAAALKQVVPAGWKYTLRVRNHSTIVMTIQSAPLDLPAICQAKVNARWANEPYNQINKKPTNFGVNPYWLDTQFEGELLETFEKIKKALKSADWYDDSDIQTDYFNTAYYFDIEIGRWNKPFVFNAPVKEAA